MRRVRDGGIGAAEILFLGLLLVPPALRLTWEVADLRGWVEESAGDTGVSASSDGVAEVAALRESLRQARVDLAAVAGTASILVSGAQESEPAPRYGLLTAAVLSFSDPAVDREALWIYLEDSLEGLGAADRGAAAIVGQRLVGRTVPSPVGFRLARVQTTADALFRVRFRSGDVSGVLWGTGRRDKDGHALLEVHHAIASGSTQTLLRPGTPLVTAGNDGIYPPGILIGEVIRSAEGVDDNDGSGRVRAALDVRHLERLTVVVDSARAELTALTTEQQR